MRGGAVWDALASAMGGVKPKIAKRYMEALERVLVKQLKETGCAKIPRVVVMKKAMRTARPEQVRKVFGIVKKVPARPEMIVYKAALAKQLTDQLF